MLTLKDKLNILIEKAALLKINAELAIEGKIEYVDVRHHYGQVRRILRTIESSLHNNAKKQRQAKAKAAMDAQRSAEGAR